MVKQKKEPVPKEGSPYSSLTGVAYTVEASKDGGFSNYRIVTLFLVDGEVVHVEKSQEFAAFETIARTEMLVSHSLWNLSNRYKPGLYQSLGGDTRDALVERLKKNNPTILRKIAPALGMTLGEGKAQ